MRQKHFRPVSRPDRALGHHRRHRRAGKTVATIIDLLRRTVTDHKEDGRYVYIAPSFAQAKDVAWTYLKRYARPILAAKPYETELRVDLHVLYGIDAVRRMLDRTFIDAERCVFASRRWASTAGIGTTG